MFKFKKNTQSSNLQERSFYHSHFRLYCNHLFTVYFAKMIKSEKKTNMIDNQGKGISPMKC